MKGNSSYVNGDWRRLRLDEEEGRGRHSYGLVQMMHRLIEALCLCLVTGRSRRQLDAMRRRRRTRCRRFTA